jgi:type I restriction enzyme, R subunit
MSNEAFARVKIDALLAAQGLDTLDNNAVRFEVQLPDGKRADYELCDHRGRSPALIEAKRYSVNPGDAAAQAKAYARQLGVPCTSRHRATGDGPRRSAGMVPHGPG